MKCYTPKLITPSVFWGAGGGGAFFLLWAPELQDAGYHDGRSYSLPAGIILLLVLFEPEELFC